MKIAILGLGPSITEYEKDVFDYSIGVNDVWRLHQTDAVVCLDYPKVFKPDRLKVINECTPKAFYSSLVIWDTRKDFVKINLHNGYPDYACNVDSPMLYKSYCSPFVATQISYKYHYADEIHLFGVGKTNHSQEWRDHATKYLHPFFQLINVANYFKFPPYVHHGSPCFQAMNEIKRQGLDILIEYPGLSIVNNEGEPGGFIIHNAAGTRGDRRRKGLVEIEQNWDRGKHRLL